MNVVARIALALEAIADGDTQFATSLLEDLERELRDQRPNRRYRCPNCGNTYRWPGELDHHLRFATCWQRPGKAAPA